MNKLLRFPDAHVVEFHQIPLIADAAFLRAHTYGGEKLSQELSEILALIIFYDYALFPARNSIEGKETV